MIALVSFPFPNRKNLVKILSITYQNIGIFDVGRHKAANQFWISFYRTSTPNLTMFHHWDF